MVEHQYKVNKIIKQIDKYEYVSFDIFDTLIKRNIQRPSDIFELVQLEYENKYNKKIYNYKDIRTRAEIKARALDKNREPNIDDIYKCLELNKKEYDIEDLKKIEINLEDKFCQRNYDFYPIYKYCIENDKKIIITSDMYLKKEQIIKILDNAGIKKYDYLFLSNDVKLNKHNGKIYKYILDKVKIKSNQILHIGDSKRGDYIFPKIYRIKSILIPKRIKKSHYYKYDKSATNLETNILQTYINNNLSKEITNYEQIGYELLGPLLYGYTRWLIEQLSKQDIKKVFFLAREGNLLKKAFEIINNNEEIETNYLYVSRKSTRCCNLSEINTLQELLTVLKMKKMATLEDLFIKVGLEINNYSEIEKKYKNIQINQIQGLELIFEEIKEDIKDEAQKEEENLLGYLKQEEFYGKLAVVDIGWAGTMQNALSTIMKKNEIASNIYGFYVGKDNKSKYKVNATSYIQDFESIRAFVHLFEEFFLAQHGTTLKYKYENNKYEPVLANYEYSDNEKEIFFEIQKGAINFCEGFNKLDLIEPLTEDKEKFYEPLERLGTNPSLKEVKSFDKCKYADTTKGFLTTEKNILYYIFKPKKFYEDFYKSGWKIGFLKKIFRIKLPYFRIYRILLKIKKNN